MVFLQEAQLLRASLMLFHLCSGGGGWFLLFSCVICVDRMDGDVSSSNYTKKSDLFQNTKATGSIN
jgi:hypothetical protein